MVGLVDPGWNPGESAYKPLALAMGCLTSNWSLQENHQVENDMRAARENESDAHRLECQLCKLW
jgi:hypothetical protein